MRLALAVVSASTSRWNRQPDVQKFFTDPAMIAAFERHVDAVLNHRNSITGLLYRDDPTIMAWENCNMCGLNALFTHGSLKDVAAWSEAIGAHIKQVDHHHLYLDTSGIFRSSPASLDNHTTDVVAFEEYPHWDSVFGVPFGYPPTTAKTFSDDAAAVTSHGKAFIVNEFGWDDTDWKTQADLQHLLDSIANDPNISGDGFWALQAHLDNFGFPTHACRVTGPQVRCVWRVRSVVGALLSRDQDLRHDRPGHGRAGTATAQPRRT